MNDKIHSQSYSDSNAHSDAQPDADSVKTAGKKPNAGWFQKGRSPNPKGRPRGSGSRAPQTSAFKILLDKMLTVTIGNRTREISLEEALQQRTFKDALNDKRQAVREVVKWIIKREVWFKKNAPQETRGIELLHDSDPDNADAVLVLLGIAGPNPEPFHKYAKRTALLLEPWAVQEALCRKRGGKGLTNGQRDGIQRATRDPDSLGLLGDSSKLTQK